MDTQLKRLEGRVQEVVAEHKETQAKLLIAEETLLEQQQRAALAASSGTAASPAAVAEGEEASEVAANLRQVVADKDAEICRMQGELESIKLEVLNLVNQEKSKAEEAQSAAAAILEEGKVARKELEDERSARIRVEEKLALSDRGLADAESRLELEEDRKREMEGKLDRAAEELSGLKSELADNRVDPEAEQNRIVEALREIRETTTTNIAEEESTASVAALVGAMKSSFALHLLPSSLTNEAEAFFDGDLTTAFRKLVDKKLVAKEAEYLPQIEALKDALNVKIEDANDKIEEDQRGEEISQLRADLETAAAAAGKLEAESEDRRAELEAKAAIVAELESTIAETKQQLFQLQTSLTQEAESAARLRDLVAAKEAEIVDGNRKLEATKEELSASVEKAIDAAVAKSTLVFDEEKRKLEAEAKAKEKNYNAILKETEGMLSKLQASVEAEERRWTTKFQAKEEEFRGWKTGKEEEEKLAKEVADAFRVELESKVADLEREKAEREAEKAEIQSRLAAEVAGLEAEKGDWEAEKAEIHSRLAAAEDRLVAAKENAATTAAALAESQGSLEAELEREKQAKEELVGRLESASEVERSTRSELEGLTAELTAAREAAAKAGEEARDVAAVKRTVDAEVIALKKEVESLTSQLSKAKMTPPPQLTTTPSKKEKKEKEKKSEEKKAKSSPEAKNGDVVEGEVGAANNNGAGDNVSLGGVSIGAGEEKKKKGKSLAKLFSPKSK